MIHIINDTKSIIKEEITTLTNTTIPNEVVSHGIIIPVPKLVLYDGSSKIAAKWNAENKEFLKFNPKYYLFRYRGKGRKDTILEHKPRRKGFYHPTHLNGSTHIKDNWWSGTDRDNSGVLMPPRYTEWVVPVSEGLELELSINFNDWVFIVTDSLPTDRINARIRGACSNTTRNVYFKLAIGIDTVTNSNGCPITFGPMSGVFSIRPVNNHQDGYGKMSGWSWFIGK